MLEGIFGNKTAERVLVYIYHYGEAYASAISKDFAVALNPVRQQLDRFEKAGVLASKEAGRTRIYSFNPKYPFTKPVKDLVALYYDSFSLADRQKMFATRRRPRRKGKPA